MKRAEVLALSDALRRVLAAIEAGELVASQATVHRLQGAVVALDVVLNNRSTMLEALADGDEDLFQRLAEGLLP